MPPFNVQIIKRPDRDTILELVQLIYCSQDQWDIYKLDPEYDCLVRALPSLTAITRKKGKGRVNSPSNVASESPSPPPYSKRRPPTPDSNERPSAEPRKRYRTYISVSDSSSGDESDELPSTDMESSDDEEDEVEDLVAEKYCSPKKPSAADRARKYQELEQNRQHRRERLANKMKMKAPVAEEQYEIQDVEMKDYVSDAADASFVPAFTFASASTSATGSTSADTPKRKVSPRDEPRIRRRRNETSASPTSNFSDSESEQRVKRARTRSPGIPNLEAKRAQRAKRRLDRFRNRKKAWNDAMHEKFMESVMADVPPRPPPPPEETAQPYEGGPQSQPQRMESPPATDNAAMDEDAARLAAIEESRRKLAELEKDRPIWEEAARKRRAAEEAEEAARRARKEAERQAAEAEARRRREEARAEAERKERETKERAGRDRHEKQRKLDNVWRSHKRWTAERAYDRYRLLSDWFDDAKFTANAPLTFDLVPWPVLQHPSSITVEDIDWNTVEAFFKAMRAFVRPQEYVSFVEKSHKRFHPDRWRARGLLRSIDEEELRNCLEVAANTVAQAVTPLWRSLKSNE
ncbi:hypothetical protein IEO21_01406 [Rhodonia placenta]|uniref:Uncharacterized protein n=1 Tax=Rhodonia placenta TaxID=104341 RepID=A0A8H7P9S1_9APHY|nr:hypothetical protein IEO21_01406 [Postia placenta]